MTPSKPTTESPSTEAMIADVEMAPTLRADPCVAALVARTRELEAEKNEAVDAAGRGAVNGLRLTAEVAALRAEAGRELRFHAAALIGNGKLNDEIDALRTKLASTEAALVGLREAATEMVGRHDEATRFTIAGARVGGEDALAADAARHALSAAITSSAALGARVIEEAERRGRDAERARDGYTADDVNDAVLMARNLSKQEAAASIEAAREEGRAEGRQEAGDVAEATAQRIVAERDAALATVTAERDEASTKLAAVSEACRPLIDETSTVEVTEEHYAALRRALTPTGPSLASIEAKVWTEAAEVANARAQTKAVSRDRAGADGRPGVASHRQSDCETLEELAHEFRTRAARIRGGA